MAKTRSYMKPGPRRTLTCCVVESCAHADLQCGSMAFDGPCACYQTQEQVEEEYNRHYDSARSMEIVERRFL